MFWWRTKDNGFGISLDNELFIHINYGACPVVYEKDLKLFQEIFKKKEKKKNNNKQLLWIK